MFFLWALDLLKKTLKFPTLATVFVESFPCENQFIVILNFRKHAA